MKHHPSDRTLDSAPDPDRATAPADRAAPAFRRGRGPLPPAPAGHAG